MYAVAAIVGILGIVFLAGAQGLPGRMVVGALMLLAAIVIGWLTRAKAPERTIVQKIDLSGDVSREEMKCRNCGGTLDEKSVQMVEGAVTVKCPYCGSSYHLEEAPKW
jgi:Zn finger protein HypA/HybF involved in hydrogenase expression